TNGGTGLAKRDVTVPTLLPTFERVLPGFGELFRFLSYEKIGSAAMLSGAAGGVYHGRLVFCLPGSPDACRLAMERLILLEPGHAVGVMGRGGEERATDTNRGDMPGAGCGRSRLGFGSRTRGG